MLIAQSCALAYERGKVLSAYISALSKYEQFGGEEALGESSDFDFVSALCSLIAGRPRVFIEAFDRDPPLRALVIDEVGKSFDKAVESTDTARAPASSPLVTITVLKDGNDGSVVVPSILLRAAIILLSNWKRRDNGESDMQNAKEEASISRLLRESGLSSAKYEDSGERAVSVDEVNHCLIFAWF